MITISAFRSVPPFARGQVRDLRDECGVHDHGDQHGTGSHVHCDVMQ